MSRMFPVEHFQKMLEEARRFDGANLPKDLKVTIGGDRVDAAESAFFARQLEYLRPGVMEVQYPELKGASLVPVDTNVDPGATNYTYRVYDHFGSALVTSSLATEIPRADVNGSESSQVIRSVVIAYGYDIQEAQAAMLAKTPLTPMKAMAARDIIERTLDDIIFLGNTVMGLKGILNQSSPVTYTVPNGAGGSPTWELKTPDEILKDLNGIVNKVVTDSKEIEQPDTLLLPLTSYTLISTTRMGDGDSSTILDFFKRNNPYIKSVEATHKAESHATAWTGKRMIAYRKDPMKLSFILSQPFNQLPPQAKGFEVITNCHARTGGVIVYAPKSIAVGDGI